MSRHRGWSLDGTVFRSQADAQSRGKISASFFAHQGWRQRHPALGGRGGTQRLWKWGDTGHGRAPREIKWMPGRRTQRPADTGDGARWCQWAQGSNLWLRSTIFTGTCVPPSHPRVRMWNFFVACTKPDSLRSNPGAAMRRGIRLWELRERVRTGATARPEKLTWASQPTVLDYDATHVIYAMLSKRGGKVPYVGVTSMSSWERWKTRMATVHLGEKGDKEALSIPFTRHLVRGGTASAICTTKSSFRWNRFLRQSIPRRAGTTGWPMSDRGSGGGSITCRARTLAWLEEILIFTVWFQ